MCVVWLRVDDGRNQRRTFIFWLCGLLCAVVWLAKGTVLTLADGAGDSFYTLSLIKRTGLTVLTILLLLVLQALSDFKSRYLISHLRLTQIVGVPLDLLLTLFLFVVWFSLAPQIYYFYYQQIIPGLPQQWIADSIRLTEIRQLLGQAGALGYSLQSAQIGLWSLIWVVLLRWLAWYQVHQSSRGVFRTAIVGIAASIAWALWHTAISSQS